MVNNKNIIVTGADGFVGRHLIPKLLRKKYNLIAIGGNSLYYKNDSRLVNLSHLDYLHGDFKKTILDFNPNIILHLAGYASPLDTLDESMRLIDANIIFLVKMLDLTKNIGVSTFINMGSCTEYDAELQFNPAYLYSATKTASRQIINYFSSAYNFNQITIVPYHIYGVNNGKKKVFDLIYSAFEAEVPIDFTPGFQVLDFIHISDFTDLLVRVLERAETLPNNCDIFAGTGQGISLRDLVIIFEKSLGRSANIRWGGVDYRLKDPQIQIADIKDTKRLLNWEPSVTITHGVNEYIEIMRKGNV